MLLAHGNDIKKCLKHDQEVSFPTNEDLADFLGMTDIHMLFLFHVSRSLDLKIARFPDFQMRPALDELSDLSDNASRGAGSPCCD